MEPHAQRSQPLPHFTQHDPRRLRSGLGEQPLEVAAGLGRQNWARIGMEGAGGFGDGFGGLRWGRARKAAARAGECQGGERRLRIGGARADRLGDLLRQAKRTPVQPEHEALAEAGCV